MKIFANVVATATMMFIFVFSVFLLMPSKKAEDAASVFVPKAEVAKWVPPVAEPLSFSSDAEEKKAVEPVSVATPVAETHIVRRGETIEGLAKHYGILPWQLRAANGMEAKDSLLKPGQSVAIPSVDWKSRAYEGRASWYGPGFHGKRRADTTVYDQDEILIAHRTLPLGSSVRITNLSNGKVIVAKVLDRGPYTKGPDGKYLREIDLSRGAAEELDAILPGVIRVRIEPV